MKSVYILSRFAFMLAGLLFTVAQADEPVSADFIRFYRCLSAIISEQGLIRIVRCWLYYYR
jgi:hypothetical protein